MSTPVKTNTRVRVRVACGVVRALWCVCGVVFVVYSVLVAARVGLRGVCTMS